MSTIKAANIQNPSAGSAAIVLDTSGNFSVPAGTVSAPGIQAPSDSNTGIFFPAADTIAFAEGGVEAMRIDSSSRLLVGTSTANANGGILQLTGGITFPATAVAATDANTLDDYEEGTWTPIDSSGAGLTFTSTAGSYTKIGTLCYVSGGLTFPSTANASSAIIGGLPFNPSSATQYQNFGPPIRNNKSLSMQIFGINNTTFLLLGIGQYTTYVLNSAMTSGTMQFSFTYQTA